MAFTSYRTRAGRRARGFSLIELLVVIAIIGILLGMYMSTFHKVFAKANRLKAQVGMEQDTIGRMADNANVAVHTTRGIDREACRAAFHRTLDTTDEPVVVTEMRYQVSNDEEFRAYYFTLIDPAATDPLQYNEDGELIAKDDLGNTYYLAPTGDDPWSSRNIRARTAVMWEFLSTNMGDMNSNNIGITVAYNDGHTEYATYPNSFPATRTVAELSRRFVSGG